MLVLYKYSGCQHLVIIVEPAHYLQSFQDGLSGFDCNYTEIITCSIPCDKP